MKRAGKWAIQSIVLTGLAISGLARAGLVIEKPAIAPPSKPIAAEPDKAVAKQSARKQLDLNKRQLSNIEQVGFAPSFMLPVKGMGNSVTLMDALRQVMPSQWKVFSEGAIDQDVRVDWVGNRPWPQIVNSVLVATGNQAVLDWSTSELTISPLATKPQSSDSNRVVNAADISAPVTNPVVPAAPVVKTWKMTHGPMIKQNLEAWSKSIGWTVEWTAREGNEIFDYSAEPFSQFEFKGELMGTKGVFARVIAAFADSEPPLAVEFFPGNKRVEVSIYRKFGSQSVDSSVSDEMARASHGK